MKKFNNLLAGLAVIALAASCTNEEPAGVTPLPGTDGTQTVMKVNIKVAQPGSRGSDGGYAHGNTDEQKVSTANFFFFDADGIYVAQADLWTGNGTPNPSDNIDFESENLLVLKGLTQKSAPKYLVTVLNAGNNLAEQMIVGTTTLEQFRETITNEWNWSTAKLDGKNLFVMSTTSHSGQGDNWGTTVLSDNDLQVLNKAEDEITKADIDALNPVNVYVERLAVKYTLITPSEQTITLTIAGDDNTQVGESQVAAEEVKVTIDGFGIVNVADKSYLMKHLVEPSNFEGWNNDTDHRSFWAKSFYYDETTSTGLTSTPLADVMANKTFAPLYSNENTKPFLALQLADANNRVNASLVTNAVFSATVTAKDGSALDLVNYNGIFYKEEQFRNYVLNRMKNSAGQAYSGLNFYKKVADGTTTTDGEGVVTTTGATYKQIETSDLKTARRGTDAGSPEFTYVLVDGITELYAANEDGTDCTLITDGVTVFNTQLRSMFDNTNNFPVRYKGGKTYYTIPVEHLVASSDKVVDKDGQFGVVRNHWYQFTIEKIMQMGEGVYDPEGLEGPGDQISPEPDPQKDKYAMACQINILSWKVVNNNIIL